MHCSEVISIDTFYYQNQLSDFNKIEVTGNLRTQDTHIYNFMYLSQRSQKIKFYP